MIAYILIGIMMLEGFNIVLRRDGDDSLGFLDSLLMILSWPTILIVALFAAQEEDK